MQFFFDVGWVEMVANVLHLKEVGYFEAHNFLPAVNLI